MEEEREGEMERERWEGEGRERRQLGMKGSRINFVLKTLLDDVMIPCTCTPWWI